MSDVTGTIIAPPALDQLALADFVERGELDRHVRRMRLRYRRRRDVLVAALEDGTCRSSTSPASRRGSTSWPRCRGDAPRRPRSRRRVVPGSR
jgi:DNA-binding transcriptional MocR family regulator